MTSRRPPLNLSEPKSKTGYVSDLRPIFDDVDDGGDGAKESLNPEPVSDITEPDILDAPLNNRPPVSDTQTQNEAPEAIRFSPPPETTPPATTESAKQAPEPNRRDLSTFKIQPEGVLKATGMRGSLFWGGTIFISLLWACGIAAFALGAQSNLSAMAYDPFKMVVLAFLALFPAGMIFASAFALRNAAALSRQAQRTAALADAMLAPVTAAAHQTGDLVEGLRAQVDHAVRAVRLAHADISELSSQLKSETERLQDAAQIARAATLSVTRSLEHEREALSSLSQSLTVQSTNIIEAVDRQARMVADASDLAQTQLREAEASLASSTGSMIEAAADISNAARTASEDLDRQTVRLETAGSSVADQIRSVEDGLSQQRAGLVSAALSLRADQEDFAVHIENQRTQLTEALSITRVATVDLGETSARGIDVLRDIVVAAQENFQSLNSAAENERTSFETRIHATLSNISVMAADARDDLIIETRRALEQLNVAAEAARRAADQAAQSAQMRVDRLNESIFEAGKKADDVFDARFSTARRLIEDSAELISEAGDQTVQRLDASFVHTRQTIEDMNNVLNELSNGADKLPVLAQVSISEIRKSVEDGIQAMMTAAQMAAQETEAVDLAFQERVKRNYDMLTEAVRLMGVISGDQPLPQNAPTSDASTTAPDRFRQRDYGRAIGPQHRPQPEATPSAPRLRLSPLAAVTRPASGSPTSQTPKSAPLKSAGTTPDGWSWRELLGSMEGRDASKSGQSSQTTAQPPNDPEFGNLDELMIAEVNAIGVDSATLLNRARIDEITGAILAEDSEGARLVVRRVAPAAVRRLSRRLLSDSLLRQQANDFATFYDQQVNIALMSKDVSHAIIDVLSSESGRAYLLLDAAMSDLT